MHYCATKARVLCPTGFRFMSTVSGDTGNKLGRVATFGGVVIPSKSAGNMNGGTALGLNNDHSWLDDSDIESSGLASRLVNKFSRKFSPSSPGPPTETSNDTAKIASNEKPVSSLSHMRNQRNYEPDVNMETKKAHKSISALDEFSSPRFKGVFSSRPGQDTSAPPRSIGDDSDVLFTPSASSPDTGDGSRFRNVLSSQPGRNESTRPGTSGSGPKFKNTFPSQPITDGTLSRKTRNGPLSQRVSSSSPSRQSSTELHRDQPGQEQVLDEDSDEEVDLPPIKTEFHSTDLDQLFLESKESTDNITSFSFLESQGIPKRVLLALELYGGDYSRILPETVNGQKLDPIRRAQATLGRRRDISTRRRERTLSIVQSMVKEVRA